MAPHSSTLAWKIPWTEEPGRPQSIEWHRVGYNRSNLAHTDKGQQETFPASQSKKALPYILKQQILPTRVPVSAEGSFQLAFNL